MTQTLEKYFFATICCAVAKVFLQSHLFASASCCCSVMNVVPMMLQLTNFFL